MELDHLNFPVGARSPALKPRKPTQPTSLGCFWSDTPDLPPSSPRCLGSSTPTLHLCLISPHLKRCLPAAFPNLPCPAQDTLFRLPLKHLLWNSLVVQWLGLSAFTAEATSSIPGHGSKFPQAFPCGQTKALFLLPGVTSPRRRGST